MRPWQVIWASIRPGDWFSTLVSQLSSRLLIAGGLSAFTCSWVKHMWVVEGWPELGIGRWRAFIIASASGGICGALDICMVEVMVHSPGRPCAAKAATGTSTRLAAIRAESGARSMTVPLLASGANVTERRCGVNFAQGTLQLEKRDLGLTFSRAI